MYSILVCIYSYFHIFVCSLAIIRWITCWIKRKLFWNKAERGLKLCLLLIKHAPWHEDLRGSECIAQSFSTSAPGDEWSASYTWDRKYLWATEQVWTLWSGEKSVAPVSNWTPAFQSLARWHLLLLLIVRISSLLPLPPVYTPNYSLLLQFLRLLSIRPFSGPTLVTVLLVPTDSPWALLRRIFEADVSITRLVLFAGCLAYSSIVNMGAEHVNETSVNFYHTTRHQITEYYTFKIK